LNTLVRQANEDVLAGVQWVSTLDDRTMPICQNRDGMTYELNGGPRPPAHPNCRSTAIPITRSWEELGQDGDEIPEGTRASMDGQVPRSVSFYEWLKKQPESVQREALGPRRFAL